MSTVRTKITFARIHFHDRIPGRREVEIRLRKFLLSRRLRRPYLGKDVLHGPDHLLETDLDLSNEDRSRIARRAALYLDRCEAATGMAHLCPEDRAQLQGLRMGMSVARVSSEHEADVLAAALHEDMPWLACATEHVWHAMRRSVREGQPGLRMAPILLAGPPGIGKTHWARQLGRLLDVPTTFIDGTGEPASFSLVGSQRGWSNARPGKVLQTILRERCASPIVVVDEVEKAGETKSSSRTRFTLTDDLLPLLEPSTAATWQCPYYRVGFDMSWVGWVLTANSLPSLPHPLRSRCTTIELQRLSRRQLETFALREATRRGLPETAIAVVLRSLQSAPADKDQASLRTVQRMIERAENILALPVIH